MLLFEYSCIRFIKLIRSGDDFSHFRVNPLKFGSEKDVSEKEVIDLLLHGARIGLFEETGIEGIIPAMTANAVSEQTNMEVMKDVMKPLSEE